MTFDKKEYQKEYMRKRRMEERGEPHYEWQKVDKEILDELTAQGRGVPVKGFVLISTKDKNSFGSVVTEESWRARLDWTCKHGREGWSCKECLK